MRLNCLEQSPRIYIAVQCGFCNFVDRYIRGKLVNLGYVMYVWYVTATDPLYCASVPLYIYVRYMYYEDDQSTLWPIV